jgi:hypothetical protein
MRLLGGIVLALLVLALYYMLVEYAPYMLKSAVAQAVTYNEYIAPPDASQYFSYFLVILITFVAGYVAYRDRY